jgi:cyclohexadienyl dehydratase
MGKEMIVRMLAGLAAIWLMTCSAQAQQPVPSSRLDEIVKRGTLRVGMTGDYLPFTYLDKSTRQFRGFDVDWPRRSARRSASRSSTSRPHGRS